MLDVDNPMREDLQVDSAVRPQHEPTHSFSDQFNGFFMRFDKEEKARKKLEDCSMFCALMGLENSKHCKRIVQATCALSKCSFDTPEIQKVLKYALVNLNREYDYVSGLDARQRAHVAVCHIYIAQAMLFDDFANIRVFCQELYGTSKTLPFFERVLTVMTTWNNRVVVNVAELADASKFFVDLNES